MHSRFEKMMNFVNSKFPHVIHDLQATFGWLMIYSKFTFDFNEVNSKVIA